LSKRLSVNLDYAFKINQLENAPLYQNPLTLGLDIETLDKICFGASVAGEVVQVANDNCPGQVVISGGITKMLPVKAGDRFEFSLTGQPTVTVSFS